MKEFSQSTGEALPTDAADHFAHLPLSALVGSLTNPRKNFREDKLQELADSIKASGVHQPILVRPLPGSRVHETSRETHRGQKWQGYVVPTHEIVSGERRFRASTMAGAQTIPALIRPLTDDQVLEIQIVENLQRDDLTELEEAEGYEALMQHNSITADEVGTKIGKSRSYVYGRLKLLDLGQEAKQALRDGTLDASRAVLIARIPDPQLQIKALTHATTVHPYTQLPPSLRELQTWLQQNVMLRLERAPFKITDARLLESAGSCKDCPKRTGANPDLFADVDGADICTDPTCYNEKASAHRAAIVARAEAKGMTVIEGAAAKKICRQYGPQLEGYTLLNQQREDTTTPGKLSALLGKDAPAPVLIENPWTKELVEAVPTDEAEAVLLAKGLIRATTAASNAQAELDNEVEYLKASVKVKTDREARKAMFTALQDAVRSTPDDKAAALISPALVRAWLTDCMDDLDHEDTALVLQVELADDYSTTEIDAVRLRLQACDSANLYRSLALYLMLDDRQAAYGKTDTHPLFDAIANGTGTDLQAIHKEAAEDVKAEISDKIREIKAAHKAAQKPPADAGPAKPAKPPAARKQKLSATDAQSGIADAMQSMQAEEPSGNGLELGLQVTVTTDTDRLGMTQQRFAGKQGRITRREDGGGFWDVTFKGRTGGVAMFAEDQLSPAV